MNADDLRRHSVGVLGCGNVLDCYVRGLAGYPDLTLARVGDVDVDRARVAAQRFAIPAWGDDEALYADPSIDIVINLTPPVHHAHTTIRAVKAGKHVYVEKPLATTVADGEAVVEAARSSGRMVGAAPDTFLGSAGQTARRAIDEGAIGEPIGACAFVRHGRAETWHPDPRFLFTTGGGPVMDMGPYHVAALVNCLGPFNTVAAAGRIGTKRRRVTSPDRVVEEVDVEVATHTSAVMTSTSGVIVTALMSFDIWNTDLPFLEIYGTHGALSLPDPNDFDGDVRVRSHHDDAWKILHPVIEPLGQARSRAQLRRGLGVKDMVGALRGGPHRTSLEFAFHVLEVLVTMERACTQASVVSLASTCGRPEPVLRQQSGHSVPTG